MVPDQLRFCYRLISRGRLCLIIWQRKRLHQARADAGLTLTLLCLPQEGTHQLVESGRYDTREDFTVVVQPFFEKVNMPKNSVKKASVVGKGEPHGAQSALSVTIMCIGCPYNVAPPFCPVSRRGCLTTLSLLLTVSTSAAKLMPMRPVPSGTVW